MDDNGEIEPIASDKQLLLPRYVRRAVTHLHTHLSDRVTLAGLAFACGTSERTLLKQFQKVLGQPPLAHLRRLRLNAARSKLQQGEGKFSISDIATTCGFTHFGRFATDYRRAFGESPSAARQRVLFGSADGAVTEPPTSCANGGAPSLSAPTVWRSKPCLMVIPLRTETLPERLEARDLIERLGATLSRMRVAAVSLAYRSGASSTQVPQPRNAGTHYSLRGRLTRNGERTRVIMWLVDIAADRHVWGDSFDGSADDPFELQDRVVDGVLCGAVSSITDAEVERIRGKDFRDLAAWDLAMRALPLILTTSVPNTLKAITILERAIELDPSHALAVALLGCCHAELCIRHGTPSPATARDTALQLAHRSGLLDDSDPLVMTARGMAMSLSGQDGEGLATRALAMDPTSPWAWERRGFARLGRGGDPNCAIADFTRALQLRPPTWSRSNCFFGIAAAHRSAGRLQEGYRWTQKAREENPGAAWLYRSQACYASDMGDGPLLAQAVEQLRRLQPDISVSLLVQSMPATASDCPGWLDKLVRAGLPI